MRPISLFLLLLLLAGLAGARREAAAQEAGVSGKPAANLVKNASFEHDWFHHAFAQNRRFLLLHTSDLGMAEADGRVDYWNLFQSDPVAVWDTTGCRSGSRSLRFSGPGQATHRVRFAGEQNWRSGGAHYAGFLPMVKSLAVHVARRPIRVGAWCRTEGVPAGKEPLLAITAQCLVRADLESVNGVVEGAVDKSVRFTAGTHGWEYREIRIDPAELKGPVHWLVISLAAQGGTVSFDDVTCVEDPVLPNRQPNTGFEAAGADGWPEGWGKPRLWPWWRNDYYLFTGWSHEKKADFRGGAEPDRLLTASGGRSLRMTVYPGDNLGVAGPAIPLEQDRPRPIEVRAMVRADSLRGLEIMALDETGAYLPQSDFLGDDMEDNAGFYNMGTTGAGTYDWQQVRKYFSPRKPVKSLRLVLCARGFDGVITERNRVGVVWWDDVQVFDHGGGAAAAPQPPPAAPPFRFRVTDLDLGDRLWGKNRLVAAVELPDAAAEQQFRQVQAEVRLAGPRGAAQTLAVRAEVLQAPAPGAPGHGRLVAEYRVEDLCARWTEQYRLTLRLGTVSAVFPFGTPSRVLTGGVSAYYAHPDERVTVYGQLNVARDSLAELSRCEIAGSRPEGELKLLDTRDFAGLDRPQTGPKYLDTARLVRVEVPVAGAKAHPWQEPARDHRVTVRLLRKDGSELARTEPLEFGFMQPVPRADLPPVQRTAVDRRGYLTVNGRPYFPVYWTPHFGIAKEANYPARLFGLKSVDLTPLVYAKKAAPDAEVKVKLLARIAEVKNDPQLFQYVLGEGEMQLQDAGWRERAGWLKTAAAWIREADPNHLISGPESWLVGHPGHNEAMGAFIPHFDVIGVEASFEEVPRLQQFARPLMKERSTGVLVGLETYYYQPLSVLRWRGYKALVEGAAGVGLCPSGMLEAKPDRVNFLRGLNAEFRGLADVITAPEPTTRITTDQPVIQTLERLHQGRRYLVAVRNRDTAGSLRVRFTLPSGAAARQARVRFEGRSLPVSSGAFEDRFPVPMTVRVYELD